MRIALVAPSGVPFAVGGAEHLAWALQSYLNREAGHACDLVKLPSPESDLPGLVASYRRWSELDLSGFDRVVSLKYPAWMARHPRHVCYMLHRLRGLYDTWNPQAFGARYDAAHPAVAPIEAHMAATGGDREGLAGFFGLFEALAANEDRPEGLLAFPGPFARRVVHYLDGIGLAATAIERFGAISRTVAGRSEYFPAGASVTVCHPPSNLPGLAAGRFDYFFTASRLDGPKRLSLVVEAYRRTPGDIPLLIAGTGPEREALERAAEGDARIRFLGHVSDHDLAALYRDALAVPFVPWGEDYGYITVEAMACGKPVVTCHDSGGPNEFVEHGVTGLSVAPDPAALAEAFARLASDAALAREMGSRARRKVAGISWHQVVEGLLGAEAVAATAPRARRRKVVVAITFPVYPPRGGGQSRAFHLYRELAREHDVELLTFTEPGEAPFDGEIAPGLREVRTPMSAAHRAAEDAIRERCGFLQITDIAMPELWRLTPAFAQALDRAALGADLFVASHPFLFPALEAVARGRPVAHESQDVEIDLKTQMLPDNAESRRLLEAVRAVEGACCRASAFVLACTGEEAATLGSLYGVSPEKLVVAPNGADIEATAFLPLAERHAAARRLGIDTPVALFVGSWHGPNVEAVKALCAMATEVPEVAFVVIGSVCQAVGALERPPNVALLGVVDDTAKAVLYETASVALNPMTSGTGTNLKMLDYLAAGIPVVTTPVGARGLALAHGRHAEIVPLADFPAAIRRLVAPPGPGGDDPVGAMTRAAREHVEGEFDWRAIARRAFRRVRELGHL